MGWKYNDNRTLPVVKHGGVCMNRATWRYCPYWVAKNVTKTRVVGYRCTLFDTDKIANQPGLSLPECNAKYGTSYDGDPNPDT